MKKKIALFALCIISITSFAQDAKMKTFIDALMKKMTLEEKLGQLNLPGSGDIVTGNVLKLTNFKSCQSR